MREDGKYFDCSVSPKFDICVKHYSKHAYSEEEACAEYFNYTLKVL